LLGNLVLLKCFWLCHGMLIKDMPSVLRILSALMTLGGMGLAL